MVVGIKKWARLFTDILLTLAQDTYICIYQYYLSFKAMGIFIFYYIVHLFNALYPCEPDQRKLHFSGSNSDKTSARAKPMSYEMDGRDGNMSASHLTTAVGRVRVKNYENLHYIQIKIGVNGFEHQTLIRH